jgi:8-oxo-dGTP diphosphatase
MNSIDVRCSAIVFRDDTVLLVHRRRDGTDDWVLPGGTPRPGESMAACARRETLEETGLSVDPARVAFVLEALGPGSTRRTVDLVFLATAAGHGEPEPGEADTEALFVPLSRAQDRDLSVLGAVGPGEQRASRTCGAPPGRQHEVTRVLTVPVLRHPRSQTAAPDHAWRPGQRL